MRTVGRIALSVGLLSGLLHGQQSSNLPERTDQRFGCSVEPVQTLVSDLWAYFPGEIQLELIINAQGAVSEVKVVKSTFTAEQTDHAIHDVRQWRFLPATKNGKVVGVRTPTAITFTATSVQIKFEFLWPKGQRGCIPVPMPIY